VQEKIRNADGDLQARVQDLQARYAQCIDDALLDRWPDFFTEEGRYLLTTSDNFARELPLGMMYATSQRMLRDRIAALREVNVYEAQRYRHVISMSVVEHDDEIVRARTNFFVARIMQTGETTLFATGCYRDRIAFAADRTLRFAEKVVVLDSRQIDTLVAIPL
jgi:3-phenylpropionate/cinnamic acid dioxygenase small subunit